MDSVESTLWPELAEAERELRCFSCGYALCGLPVDHACPECGHATVDSRIRFVRAQAPLTIAPWLTGIALILYLGFAAIALSAHFFPPNLSSPHITRSIEAKREAVSISQQVNLYLLDNNLVRPPDCMKLDVLTLGPDSYLRSKDLLDPWNNPYVLIVWPAPLNEFTVLSLGADGKPGGTGENADISN